MLPHASGVITALAVLLLSATAFCFPCTPQSALWKFHTALPVAGPPVVAPPRAGERWGTVFLASHEGYIHALRADGRFLWSYTVSGGITEDISLDPVHEQVLVATTTGYIYSFRPDGGLNWRLRSAYRPQSALGPSPRGSVFFSHGSRVYAASKGGGLLWSTPLASRPVAGPRIDGEGWAWFLTDDGHLHRILRPSRQRSHETGRRGPGRITIVGERVVVVQEGALSVLTLAGEPLWQRDSDAWVAADAANPRGLVLADRAGVQWVEGSDGAVKGEVAFEPHVSAEPLVLGRHTLVPDARGYLWVVTPGEELQRCTIARASLLTPVFETSQGQLVIAAGDGQVVAFPWPPKDDR